MMELWLITTHKWQQTVMWFAIGILWVAAVFGLIAITGHFSSEAEAEALECDDPEDQGKDND